MSCYYPRKGYLQNGKMLFQKPSGHSGAYVKIACKLCVGCRLDHRRNWATRMMHEASMHPDSQFVTFQYNDESIPPDGDLYQRDMQLFFKRLRRKLPERKIRYVYSGEYGEKYSRPHYHAIIFGLSLPDKIIKDTNDRGEALYQSEFLENIWGNGFTTIGAVSYQSCAYVAAYMLKDINGDYRKTDDEGNPNPYHTIDLSTGELTVRKRPYARYSNRPGIGAAWIDKYYRDVFPQDRVITMDGIRPVPPYYFHRLKKLDPKLYEIVKAKREASLDDEIVQANATPERLKVRETVKVAKIKSFKRGSKKSEPNKTFYTSGDNHNA